MHHYFLCCESSSSSSFFFFFFFFFLGGGGGKNRDIFMAAICDMAMGRLADRRYFLESVHDLLKTDFMIKKVASSYTQMIFIVYCFQLTAPNKEKIISVSHVPDCVLIMMMMMSWCLISSDVIWHIRDKLWPMPKHGSIKSTYVRCMRV